MDFVSDHLKPATQVSHKSQIMDLPLCESHFYALEYAKSDNLAIVWEGEKGYIRGPSLTDHGEHCRYRVKICGSKWVAGPIPYNRGRHER